MFLFVLYKLIYITIRVLLSVNYHLPIQLKSSLSHRGLEYETCFLGATVFLKNLSTLDLSGTMFVSAVLEPTMEANQSLSCQWAISQFGTAPVGPTHSSGWSLISPTFCSSSALMSFLSWHWRTFRDSVCQSSCVRVVMCADRPFKLLTSAVTVGRASFLFKYTLSVEITSCLTDKRIVLACCPFCVLLSPLLLSQKCWQPCTVDRDETTLWNMMGFASLPVQRMKCDVLAREWRASLGESQFGDDTNINCTVVFRYRGGGQSECIHLWCHCLLNPKKERLGNILNPPTEKVKNNNIDKVLKRTVWCVASCVCCIELSPSCVACFSILVVHCKLSVQSLASEDCGYLQGRNYH